MSCDFLILANSIKNSTGDYKKRCLAGILNPYSESPLFCRLVSDCTGDALNENLLVEPNKILGELHPLDVIQIELGQKLALDGQPDNIILDISKPIIYNKRESKDFIIKFLQVPQNIWGTDSISESAHFGGSIYLLRIQNPKKGKAFNGRPSLDFDYNGVNYNVLCTIENFVYVNLSGINDCIICITSGTRYNDAYYKFVAGLII